MTNGRHVSACEPIIEVRGVHTRFGDKVVHAGLDLTVCRGEILAIVGGSGSGKSTLLREMILLQEPDAGGIRVLGLDLATLDERAALELRRRCGVMFQHGGLFGSITVLENVGLPLREHTAFERHTIDEIAEWKLEIVGLKREDGLLYPNELSGGMLKRASLARALALDPELLFLDEPTAGLDPTTASGFDELVLELGELFALTIVMITHDLDLLWQVADRVAVLGEGRVLGVGSMQELSQIPHPEVRRYFEGHRARAAQAQAASARGMRDVRHDRRANVQAG